jgi:hypothetical protein
MENSASLTWSRDLPARLAAGVARMCGLISGPKLRPGRTPNCRQPRDVSGSSFGANSPFSQPATLSDFKGSEPLQSRHRKVRFPALPGGRAKVK